MSDPHQPDLGVGLSVPQGLRCGNGILAEGVASAVHVDGDNLPMVVRLNKMADVPLVDLFPKAGCLLTDPARWRRHLLPPVPVQSSAAHLPAATGTGRQAEASDGRQPRRQGRLRPSPGRVTS